MEPSLPADCSQSGCGRRSWLRCGVHVMTTSPAHYTHRPEVRQRAPDLCPGVFCPVCRPGALDFHASCTASARLPPLPVCVTWRQLCPLLNPLGMGAAAARARMQARRRSAQPPHGVTTPVTLQSRPPDRVVLETTAIEKEKKQCTPFQANWPLAWYFF